MSGIITDEELEFLCQQSSKRFDFSGSLSEGTVPPDEVYRKAIEWKSTLKEHQVGMPSAIRFTTSSAMGAVPLRVISTSLRRA